MKNKILDRRTVNRIQYTHGINDTFEYYEHIDKHGWSWQVYRHNAQEHNWYWLAVVIEKPKSNHGAVKSLNTRSDMFDRKIVDPLFHINDLDGLLKGMADLIHAGKWPESTETLNS